jgi:hypothetical protein
LFGKELSYGTGTSLAGAEFIKLNPLEATGYVSSYEVY